MYLLNGLLIFCLLLFCPLDGFAKLYKWVDKDGGIHLSSTKPVEHKKEDIEKGWVPVVHFQGVEKIAQSQPFQLQGTEAKIIWEVDRSPGKKTFLDKDIKLTEKDIEHTKMEIEHTRENLSTAKKELKEAKRGKGAIKIEKETIRSGKKESFSE